MVAVHDGFEKKTVYPDNHVNAVKLTCTPRHESIFIGISE
jgi:hypothetical protein